MLWIPIVALVAADAPIDETETSATELARLKGTWRLIHAWRDGKELPADETAHTRIVFDKHVFRFPDASGIGTSAEGIITVDPAKRPKQMDAVSTDNIPSLGIYQILGDDYRVCFAPPAKPRPTEFESKARTGVILQIWQRVRYEHVIKTDAPFHRAAPRPGKRADGTWKAGTRVSVISVSGGFTLAEIEGGLIAHVASDAVEPAKTK